MKKVTTWDSLANAESHSESWSNQKRKRYAFVYSKRLAYYLIEVKGLKYITQAKRMSDNAPFFLFERSDRVEQAFKEYHKLKDNNGNVRWEQLEELKKRKGNS